jgi:lipopolysaccharide transport system ATP-binding protein
MTAVVRFEHVSKQYRLGASRTSLLRSLSRSVNKLVKPGSAESAEKQALWALRDIDFVLSRGECLGLVGQNGAGKSTLLKLLANITRPTSGRIEVNGRVSALIELGSGFHPDLTGRENVFLNGTILGLSQREIRRRFDEIVEFSELERFIDTPVKRYSSGMTVRLGFAVASCIEPDILLVDEVLAVGDASFRQKCLGRIERLLASGTSMIFVSHNINMVQAVCTSALYIKQGQIVYQGDTTEAIKIYERDLHEEQARKLEAGGRAQLLDRLTDVQITQVAVLGRNGDAVSEFGGHDGAEIQIHYNNRATIGDASVVMRIVRGDGLTCCMLRSSLNGTPLTLAHGEGIFSVIVEPLQLTGGMYYIEVCISTPMDLVLLAVARSSWFYIAGAVLSHEERSGVFEPHHRWISDAHIPVAVAVNHNVNGAMTLF